MSIDALPSTSWLLPFDNCDRLQCSRSTESDEQKKMNRWTSIYFFLSVIRQSQLLFFLSVREELESHKWWLMLVEACFYAAESAQILVKKTLIDLYRFICRHITGLHTSSKRKKLQTLCNHWTHVYGFWLSFTYISVKNCFKCKKK